MTLETTCLIYLAFHPSDDDLVYVCDLARQMNVVVVSNSGIHDFGPDLRGVHCFETNVGVGAGYNRGLELARAIGAKHVVFHDQDSRLDVANIEGALQRILELESHGGTFAISLTPVDLTTKKARQPRVTKPMAMGAFLEFREVQFSGLVAPIGVFATDPFSEYLFVDFVDFDWCWNVGRSVRFIRDESLTIGHCIGSGVQSVFGFEYSLPAPTRFYFQWRNLLVLARLSNTPMQWKYRTTAKFLVRTLVLVVVGRTRIVSCCAESIRGIRDGLSRRQGVDAYRSQVAQL
jgi:rhamnosyltransferase